MLWVMAILFFIITIMLISGKGAFLIAGYNTSSKANKQKYDEKKLCWVTGSGMGIITLFLIVLAYFNNGPPKWMIIALPIATISVTVAMMVLCSTICKVENTGALETAADESRQNRSTVKATLIFTAAVFLIIGIMLFTGKIEIAVVENSIEINGSYWANYNVNLDSIQSVSYVEGMEVGQRTNGVGSAKLLEGRFRNDEFGDYILYAYLKCDNYIILDTSDGTVVVNAETQQETQSLYNLLLTLFADF